MHTKFIKKWFVITIVFGLFYTNWELFLRAFFGELLNVKECPPIQNLSYASMAGWTSLWMIFIGGFAGLLIGLLNENEWMRKQKMWLISLVGTVIIFTVELITGLVFNRVFKLALWDYSHHWGNIAGQISLRYAPIWFAVVPLTMWFDDVVRYYIFSEDKPLKFNRYYRFNHSLECSCRGL